MMARGTKYLALLGVVSIALLAFWLLRRSHNGPSPNKLAVIFVGMTNNPSRTMGRPRVELCQGATGGCALFLVTNISKQVLWFKTAFVEQKTEGEWKRLIPGSNAWSGVEGSLWTPDYGCFMAVGWPPGLPTNACWRLGVSYGRDPSLLRTVINQRVGQPVLGRELFHSSKEESIIGSSEVRQ